MKKTAILYITENGLKLAVRLRSVFPDAEIVRYDPGLVPSLWADHAALVFIMASGIVVRTIAPMLKDKRTDPAVVVLDEAGRFAVSLVSGHLGGANDLARKFAGFLGGEAVITTASDVNHLPSIDLWAREHDLEIEEWELLPQIGTRLVNNGALRVYEEQGAGGRGQGSEIELPDEFLRVAGPRFADVIISNRKNAYGETSACTVAGDDCSIDTCRVKGQLYLRPGNLVVGIGCNSGTSQDELEDAVRSTLDSHNLAFLSVGRIATIDIKGSEPGLRAFARKYSLPLHVFRNDELNRVEGIEKSDAVFKATGAHAVAEPAALLAAGTDRLLVPKQKKGNVTVAVALIAVRSTECGVRSEGEKKLQQKGKIYIVGTGPGSLEHITPAARDAIKRSDVIVGYGTYLDLIKELLTDKEVVSTGMTQEVDRCRKAISIAREGKTVAIISGGDPGVYAMAGLVFEVLKSAESEEQHHGAELETPNSELRTLNYPSVEVIPGISALNASASRLGAPLMHDFACISLSDRLTPWDVIEKRLEAAASADFVIVLYNPRSKGRAGHINRAREIILKHRKPTTAVGIVKGAMRTHETIIVTDLERMQVTDVDMQTTVLIGNSKTFVWNNLMITPRGYERKLKI
ncbi:MAG: precorrin-3B C(17)-methyltransferase [Nitrospirota bacterium]